MRCLSVLDLVILFYLFNFFLELEESLPGMSETIPVCELGEEESPWTGRGNRPEERSPPRSLLQSPVTSSSAVTDNPQPSWGEVPRHADFFPAPLPFPPERPEPREDEEKGALPLPFFFPWPDWPEVDEEVDCFWAWEAPEVLAWPERAVEDTPDSPADAGFRGILGGWRVCCTRVLLAAARILSKAESNKACGKIAADWGRGEYLNHATSSAGTVPWTSASRACHLARMRLQRVVHPWLARNSRTLDPEIMSLSKSARTSIGRWSLKPPQVDNHQSNQEETSHIPESMVSIEETCEADKETERFLTSLAFSLVI